MFQKPKGTKDLFGLNANIFNLIRNTYFEVCKNFNFHYIETPIFENVNLFKRTSGEFSDIVAKEMYVFKDKSDRELALKPEGTAPTIRAIIENKLYTNPKLNQKYFYFTPTFRYEQPQKGRQRQFYQAGVEFISEQNPYNDVEILLLAQEFMKRLKISDYILKINYLGRTQERKEYTSVLSQYLTKYSDQLESNSLKKLEKNPLRILDDKIESQKDFIKNAPKISDFLNKESNAHLESLMTILEQMNIEYEYDQSLVRGLDYYDEFVFEFISDSPALGSQSAILAGGRYNGLIAELGGSNQSAIGFGCGVERLLEIMLYQKEQYPELNSKLDFYVASFNSEELVINTILIKKLRSNGFNVDGSKEPEKLKNAFKNATSFANFIIFKELNQSDQEITIKQNGADFKKIIKLDQVIEIAKQLVI